MRALTGSIVILSGSVLAGAGAVACALPRSNNAIVGGEAGYAVFFGAVLILIGLVILAFGLLSPERQVQDPTRGPDGSKGNGTIVG